MQTAAAALLTKSRILLSDSSINGHNSFLYGLFQLVFYVSISCIFSFFTYLHNKLICKKPVKIARTKRNCVCWLMNQISKFLIWSGEWCGDIKNCSKNWLAFISSVEWKSVFFSQPDDYALLVKPWYAFSNALFVVSVREHHSFWRRRSYQQKMPDWIHFFVCIFPPVLWMI